MAARLASTRQERVQFPSTSASYAVTGNPTQVTGPFGVDTGNIGLTQQQQAWNRMHFQQVIACLSFCWEFFCLCHASTL